MAAIYFGLMGMAIGILIGGTLVIAMLAFK